MTRSLSLAQQTAALSLLTAMEGALRGRGPETDELCAEARSLVLEAQGGPKASQILAEGEPA